MPTSDGNSDDRQREIDGLAGVVTLGLLAAHPKTMTTEDVCVDVERDPLVLADLEEVEAALRALVAYDLATNEADGRWKATLAAVKADELSF